MTDYEVVIGIETHVQLATKTKLFCACDNDAREAEPNTKVCPVCMGFPGTLPVLNEMAVKLALRLGLALNADYQLPMHTKFDRKNYFYPDLPKGYQITQFDEPIVPGGWVEFPLEGGVKRVGITRAHLEGAAGKLTHPDGADYSLVDLNRAETPLVEIVSEPDMSTAAEAKGYAQELHNIVRYAGVSAANLYFGNMRFDVNVSVRPVGASLLGTRTETKNLNSFRAIERVVEYESARQVQVIEGGGTIRQETRGWNDAKQTTYPMRSKEDADEYRYFPEPDLPPVVVTQSMIDDANDFEFLPAEIRAALSKATLPADEIEVLVSADDLEAIRMWHQVWIENPEQVRFAFNWLIGDHIKLAEEKSQTLGQSDITSLTLAMVGKMVQDGKLSSSNAKVLLRHLWDQDEGAIHVAEKLGLIQESDEGALGEIVDQVIASQAQAVADYRGGNERAFGALVGAAMKASRGQGNPQVLSQLLRAKLGK